jgi:hypothetical protein
MRAKILIPLLLNAMPLLVTACSSSTTDPKSDPGPPLTLGESHAGQYNLGPVDWRESQWHNSCAPYPASVQASEGELLAGLALGWNGDGRMCDACVFISTAKGKSVLARVVTTGVTQGPNDIDLSPAAYAALDQGEYPRDMSWQIAKCPATGNVAYQFQTGANIWWTSLWVRNVRLPLASVQVKSANHPAWFALKRGSDGTYTDAGGFGDGAFTLRLTSIDSQTVTDDFPSLQPGKVVGSTGQFQ